jgi:galactose mutarotase-like enzyme
VTRPWAQLSLESPHLRAVVLPDKGAEMVELRDLRTGIDLLAHLRPTPPDDGGMRAAGTEFDRWYAGGWQTILPNGGDACRVGGVEHAFHGEAWARPFSVLERAPGRVGLEARLSSLPLEVRRLVELDPQRPALHLRQEVRNAGPEPVLMMWGEHPAFGPPLVSQGARLHLPECRVDVIRCDSRSRLRPASGVAWPLLEDGSGARVDASRIPGPEIRAHDLCLARGLAEGRYAIENPAVDLRVDVEFDHTLFPRLWIWQLYGDADDPPFRGGYCLAVEPFTADPGLEQAVSAGDAIELAPGESRVADLRLSVRPATSGADEFPAAGRSSV